MESLSAPPFPDIRRHGPGRDGVEGVYELSSGVDGPTVVVTALMHGNEVCGAFALDRLLALGLKPRRGRVMAVFANLAAYDAGVRLLDEDMNRLWRPDILDGPGSSRELERARAIRPVIDEADVLLDLHSMQLTAPPIALCGPLEKNLRLAQGLNQPLWLVRDAGHSQGVRLRDYGPFGDPARPQTALLVECGRHDAAESCIIACAVLADFLETCGLLSRLDLAALKAPSMDHNGPRRMQDSPVVSITHTVTARTARFRFIRPLKGLEILPQGGAAIARDGNEVIRTPYDRCVAVMPALAPEAGQTAVRLGRIEDSPCGG